MGTSRSILNNAAIRHGIHVQRFAGGVLKEILPELDRIRDDTVAKLAKDNIASLQKKRLELLLKQVNESQKLIYDDIERKILNKTQEFGEYEAEFSARMIKTASSIEDVAVPSGSTIKAALKNNLMSMTTENIGIFKALTEFKKKKQRQLLTTIRGGIITGKTNEELIKEITELVKINKHHADSLVRTITKHTSSVARQETMNANADILEGYELVATLDSRTTETCMALDGKIEPINSSLKPPFHWRCRTEAVPRIKKEYRIQNDVPAVRPARGAGGVERVDSRVEYSSWLKSQPANFQDDVLGGTKGKLFREGGLSIDKFVDKNYQPYTIAQLRKKEPLAFERAGI